MFSSHETNEARVKFIAVAAISGLALAGLAVAAGSSWAKDEPRERIPFKAARMIIEYNSSARDIGIQFFLDAEGWEFVKIYDPEGEQVFKGMAKGIMLTQGGGTELFVESEEPSLDELPLPVFFDRFPEGTYKFRGRTVEDQTLVGKVEFSHEIPAGPQVVTPVPGEECLQNVAIPVLIDWNAVTVSIEGSPIEISRYEVIVENDTRSIDIFLDPDVTQLTVPAEFFDAGTDYLFEVLAIAANGNQTITEGCFKTAP